MTVRLPIPRADLIGETVETRCRPCGKRLLVDIGPNLFGHDSAVYWCPNCQAAPQVADWEHGIRAAVAAVRAGRSA
jgi:hypothetical protein